MWGANNIQWNIMTPTPAEQIWNTVDIDDWLATKRYRPAPTPTIVVTEVYYKNPDNNE